MSTYQLSAVLSGYRSLSDRGMKLMFETGELSPQQVADIQYSLLKVVYLAIKPDPFATHEMEEIDKVKVEFNDAGKPPSQRLRAVIYRMFEQNSEGYKTFNDYYISKMEILIEHFKNKLND